ncbi:hypothetical protein JI747_002515 [Chryseobacterium sp. RG1]|uniref:Uncharacterized protein n=1 Tax=Chryseobacterium tagetis TaxID=2801334 RepID=A0ABS7ZXT8_9FLAO|nr:hypothetical protein [Chryseobacterium tagetis]MCA6066033.1 hypothetical protein [Chryseobacterium tagetis]
MKPKELFGVPIQKKGSYHDTEAKKSYADQEQVNEGFNTLKERFMLINNWKSYCGEGFADFKLFDSEGKMVERFPLIGDYIRIDIPGPGTVEAKGYDWVEITDLFEEQTHGICLNFMMMTCRPSKNPQNKTSEHIVHFYSDHATSTFAIFKGRDFIEAGIYGRNETPNMDSEFIDKARNFLIAAGGMIGISKIQWKTLVDGFLDF